MAYSLTLWNMHHLLKLSPQLTVLDVETFHVCLLITTTLADCFLLHPLQHLKLETNSSACMQLSKLASLETLIFVWMEQFMQQILHHFQV